MCAITICRAASEVRYDSFQKNKESCKRGRIIESFRKTGALLEYFIDILLRLCYSCEIRIIHLLLLYILPIAFALSVFTIVWLTLRTTENLKKEEVLPKWAKREIVLQWSIAAFQPCSLRKAIILPQVSLVHNSSLLFVKSSFKHQTNNSPIKSHVVGRQE